MDYERERKNENKVASTLIVRYNTGFCQVTENVWSLCTDKTCFCTLCTLEFLVDVDYNTACSTVRRLSPLLGKVFFSCLVVSKEPHKAQKSNRVIRKLLNTTCRCLNSALSERLKFIVSNPRLISAEQNN